MIIKEEDEKYETQVEAQEEEAPSEGEVPGEIKGRRFAGGTVQEGLELPGRRAEKGRSHRREKTSESEVEHSAGGVE